MKQTHISVTSVVSENQLILQIYCRYTHVNALATTIYQYTVKNVKFDGEEISSYVYHL